MTDRPIIFSAPMVRALLAATKTQTRRVLNTRFGPPNSRPDALDCVRFEIGDRLYVREAHYLTDDGDKECVVYAEDTVAADLQLRSIQTMMATLKLSPEWAAPHLRLRPSIHMPRWASRLTLTVTEVMVQRLQDISEEDARAEGIEHTDGYWVREQSHLGHEDGDLIPNYPPVPAYADLWNSLHGSGAWEVNPWVVAVSFIVAKGNIDEIGGAA